MHDVFKDAIRPFLTSSLESMVADRRLANANKRIMRLEADLHECLEYFKDKYDVVDGSYGEPAPNKEMQLGQMIDETLNGAPV